MHFIKTKHYETQIETHTWYVYVSAYQYFSRQTDGRQGKAEALGGLNTIIGPHCSWTSETRAYGCWGYLRSYLKLSAKKLYRGADKPLAGPGRKQATATEDFEFHISYL